MGENKLRLCYSKASTNSAWRCSAEMEEYYLVACLHSDSVLCPVSSKHPSKQVNPPLPWPPLMALSPRSFSGVPGTSVEDREAHFSLKSLFVCRRPDGPPLVEVSAVFFFFFSACCCENFGKTECRIKIWRTNVFLREHTHSSWRVRHLFFVFIYVGTIISTFLLSI